MKKKILVLAMALVIAATAAVCVSCSKKEVFEEGKVNYTFVNRTGKNVTAISLADSRSDNRAEAKTIRDGLADGESVGIEMNAMLVKNAPSLQFTYSLEGGDSLSTLIAQKNGTVTMLIKERMPGFEISNPVL